MLARTCASQAACPAAGRCRGGCTAATSGGWPIPRAAARKCSLTCRSAGSSAATAGAPRRRSRSRYRPDHPVRAADLRPAGRAAGGRAGPGRPAGARLTGRLACAVSRSTLVRPIRAAADPDGRPRWSWASMISRSARGTSTAPSWSISRPAGRSTCFPSGPRNPSAPGWMPTRCGDHRRAAAGHAEGRRGRAAGDPGRRPVAAMPQPGRSRRTSRGGTTPVFQNRRPRPEPTPPHQTATPAL